jgi:hypothetical protein
MKNVDNGRMAFGNSYGSVQNNFHSSTHLEVLIYVVRRGILLFICNNLGLINNEINKVK